MDPEKRGRKKAVIARLWALYGPQFGRILANKSIYGLFFVSSGIGRFYERILRRNLMIHHMASPPRLGRRHSSLVGGGEHQPKSSESAKAKSNSPGSLAEDFGKRTTGLPDFLKKVRRRC